MKYTIKNFIKDFPDDKTCLAFILVSIPNKILDSSDDTTIAPAKFDSLEATLWDVDDALKFLESRTERDEI